MSQAEGTSTSVSIEQHTADLIEKLRQSEATLAQLLRPITPA
jgi:hypothetical protein